MKRFVFLFLLLFLFTVAEAQSPWLKEFVPLRTFTVNSAGGLKGALSRAKPGDLILVEDGTYRGLFRMFKPGNAEHPIVVRAKNKAVIQGAVNITGAHNWVWGFEITDPGNIARVDGCLVLKAAGARGINNHIHHPGIKNSVAAWEKGSGQVLYGNIIHDGRHNLYTQNDYDRFGYKYIVSNVLLDPRPEENGGTNSFNFHGYTERSHISGFHIEKNVFAGGRWILGGKGSPHHHEVINGNYFYEYGPRLGYRVPLQVEFTNNYLGACGIEYRWLWGSGETSYSQPVPTKVTGNQIIAAPGSRHIDLKTSAFVNGQLMEEGRVGFRSSDIWNKNVYYGKFSAALAVNGQFHAGITRFVDWKNHTRNIGGNAFDLQSRVAPAPKGARTFLIPNEYDRKRAFVVVYNWGGAQRVNVRLPRPGAVYQIKAPNDAVIASGLSVPLPMNGKKFSVFLVRFFS